MSHEALKARETSFFVGYFKNVPHDITLFCIGVGAFLIGAFAALSFGLAYTATDPVPAAYIPDTRVSGTYLSMPYPMVLLAPDAEHPAGHTLLLAGDGKSGAQQAGHAFSGQAVDISGALLKRGSIDMLIVDTIVASVAKAPTITADVVSLGRWQVSGEICDGKCKAGAMKPGTGLAHKACANLCIQGGLPPLLVTAQPIAGSNFLLLTCPSGGPVQTGTWEDLVARPVTLQGAVEKVGDLLVLKADWSKAAFP